MVLFGSSQETHAANFSKAEDLYLTKCTKCHKLRDPSEYDDEKWATWMKKMKRKAHLSDEQYDLISKYAESIRKK